MGCLKKNLTTDEGIARIDEIARVGKTQNLCNADDHPSKPTTGLPGTPRGTEEAEEDVLRWKHR